MCECVRVAFLMKQRRGGILSAEFYGVSFYWSCCQSICCGKSFRLFSLSLATVGTHIQHAGGSVSQWKTFLNHIIHILSSKKTALCFACEKTSFLYLRSPSRSFNVVNIDSKNVVVFKKSLSFTHKHCDWKWGGSKKKSRVFLWHLAQIRDDLIELRIRLRKKTA